MSGKMPALLVAASAIPLLAALAIGRLVHAHDRIAARLRFVTGGMAEAPVGLASPAARLRRLGRAVVSSGLLSRKAIAALEQSLTAAGWRPGPALPLFLGAKAALLGTLPLAALLLSRATEGVSPTLALAGGVIFALMLPDLVVGRLRARYVQSLETGLPDALDLLVICAEAGLPLEVAIERVAGEFRDTNKPTANELTTTAHEMRLLPDKRVALANMAARTGMETLAQLSATLAQTIRFGTPLSQALRVLSGEMRQDALIRFEARAARLPVLLTMPLILFILPCVMLVVGGPAVLRVIDILGHQG